MEEGGEMEIVNVVLRTFGELVDVAQSRKGEGCVWMSGKGFVGFCEYWMGFAKRVSCFPSFPSPLLGRSVPFSFLLSF
jgi:separase